MVFPTFTRGSHVFFSITSRLGKIRKNLTRFREAPSTTEVRSSGRSPFLHSILVEKSTGWGLEHVFFPYIGNFSGKIYWLVVFLEHGWIIFPETVGNGITSQLTNSNLFQRGLVNHQRDPPFGTGINYFGPFSIVNKHIFDEITYNVNDII